MATEPQSQGRLQALLKIQEDVQQKWAETKPFEVDAPACPEERKKRNKFMVTFPYPYMNGALHLGHAFTVVKAEYAVRFQRLLGKKALFPFGFHCTGMPILACAQRLREELKEFGPQGPPAEVKADKKEAEEPEADEEEEEVEDATPAPATADDAAPAPAAAAVAVQPKKRKRKGKLAAKSSGLAHQWNIMRSMGVAESEIAEFANTDKWLRYWPPIAKTDLNRLGMAIDWRRTFITTDVNPYYDAFIRWQFNQLKSKGKIGFGQMMCVYSTVSEAVCADHDRKEGEGVTPQDYTLVKLELQQPYPAELEALFAQYKAKDTTFSPEKMLVNLPAATLRPETMYGQTNAFLKPDGDYGVYIMNDKDIFVCSDHSANNMAYQYIFGEYQGKPFATPKTQLSERFIGHIKGAAFFGKAVNAPLSPYGKVFLFPLTNILMDKGTAVVTSVPSDAPMDYATFMEIKQHKREYYAKTYGITDEMVNPYQVIDIINITDEASGMNTNCIAQLLCEREKVTTHKDVKLPELKEEAYRLGFDKGIMIVGPYKGELIKDVKEKAKADLIAQGLALAYSEPESKVVSRLNDTCVCALVDQWFLKYGEPEWQEQIYNHVANDATFNSYNGQVKSKLLATIRWLQRWGCSRAFGLGTKLPFDENFLIESLSDSTIYMAYYTIVQTLQGGLLDGSMPSQAQQQAGIVAPQVKVEQLNDALFDYIFFEVPYDDTKISVPQALCDKMRAEFEFWYPHDLRVSGKDLLQNHLVMSLYNHAAVWGGRTDRMPAGYYANGLLMIDGNKMSKSTGNFLTLAQAIDQYGADAVRFALASSGDSLEDANFSTKTAEGAILKFTLAQDVFDTHYFPFIKKGLYRTGDFTFWDCVALQRMSTALERMKQAYENMQMLEVIRQYHVLFQIRDEYRIAITPEGAVVTRADYVDTNFHEAVIITFMRAVSVAISPVVPHWCQSLHEQLIESGFLAKVQGVTMLSSTIPPLVIDEAWPVITVPSCGVDNIIAKAQYLLIQSDIIRTQFANYQRLHEKKAKKGPDGTIPALNHVLIRLATGYTEWQNKVISTCLEHSKQFGDRAFTDEINTLKTTVAAQFDDKKIKTNAMKFTMDLISDYKSIESGTEAEKVAQSFNTQLPFDEVGLWSQFTPFLIRAMAPILASAPETFTISPIDPANPLDEQGKPLQQPPRPLKPIFIYSNKQ